MQWRPIHFYVNKKIADEIHFNNNNLKKKIGFAGIWTEDLMNWKSHLKLSSVQAE